MPNKLSIHVLTMIGILSLVGTIGFSLGRIGSNAIINNDITNTDKSAMTVSPTPSPIPWIETSFLGTLQQGNNENFYLITKKAEAILLNYPANINLSK